jgi:hypothetical protein
LNIESENKKQGAFMNLRKMIFGVFVLFAFYFGTITSVSPNFRVSMLPVASATTKLGDLSKFKNISDDAERLVDKGELTGAKLRIKDLEVSWDEAEAGLKPRSPSDWHLIDKGIDETLTALRASQPQKSECKKALENLRGIFSKLEAK